VLTEFAGAIAAGAADVVLVLGSENGSTLRYFANRDDKPDHSEIVEGQLEDRGYGYEGLFDDYTVAHGLLGAPAQYGLLENARRAKVGLTVADYRRCMAELFAPFAEVAAKNPFSASSAERTVEEILTVDSDNRMICDPYPRLLVARDQPTLQHLPNCLCVGVTNLPSRARFLACLATSGSATPIAA
jgi:acetyl-CoA C-acetyltransferase